LTSVKASVTELSVTAATFKSDTRPGFVTVAVTVTVALPDTPPLAARMLAVPAFRAVANPVPVIATMVVSLEPQVTERPVRVAPPESLRVAVNCCVAPVASVAVEGLTVTAATGAVDPGLGVVPLATFDSPPNTAFRFSVPR
jgi:hypothetical protein